jgi:hypothetical protein
MSTNQYQQIKKSPNMPVKYVEATKALEVILNREKALRGSAPDEFAQQLRVSSGYSDAELSELADGEIYLRKQTPEIIGSGTSQVVLALSAGYVGKTRAGCRTSKHYVVDTKCAGVYYDKAQLLDSVEILRELGFEVPEHVYMGVRENGDGKYEVVDDGNVFIIAPDLTHGGRFRVGDVEEQHFIQLANGAALRTEFEEKLAIFKGMPELEHPEYGAQINAHLPEDEGEAFKRMFFMQIDADVNEGKLVLGDFDHLFLYRHGFPIGTNQEGEPA